jgi:NAD(P)-dependent dehydrogenase (short-subunit alcohol dehydrogenase family)
VTARGAIVTGAAGGIGEGIARRLATDGWSVLLFDRKDSVVSAAEAIRAETGLPEERLVAIVGDVSVENEIDAAVARAVSAFGRLDLAVANAGVGGELKDIVDVAPDAFDAVVAVNLRGAYLTCRAAGCRMREAGSGSIVTISSVFGQEPFPGTGPYSATKAGVIALTQTLALELAPHGVRVNSVAPGYIRSDMQWDGIRVWAEQAGTTFEEARLAIVDRVPLHRHGEPADIAGAVAFLASDDAAYVTGHTLGVTGGVVRR